MTDLSFVFVVFKATCFARTPVKLLHEFQQNLLNVFFDGKIVYRMTVSELLKTNHFSVGASLQ